MDQKDMVNHMVEDDFVIFDRNSQKKYTALLLPYLLKILDVGDSFLVIDPEYKLLSQTGERFKEKGYEVISINLRYPENSNSWNPLLLPYQAFSDNDMENCLNLLNDIGINVMNNYSLKQDEDPYWTSTSIDLFVGLALILFKEADDINQINLKSIYHMADKGFEKFGRSTILKKYIEKLDDYDFSKKAIMSVISAPSDTRSSILSVFYQKLRTLTNRDKFVDNISKSDFDLIKILDSKSAIFICFEDENATDCAFVYMFIIQVFELLIRKRTHVKVNCTCYHMIFNNFLSLGACYGFERLLISSKSRGIKIALDINSISLLKKTYGNNMANFILSFCSMWIIRTTREIDILKIVKSLSSFTKQTSNHVKSPFELTSNEAMVMYDGKEPMVIPLNDNTLIANNYQHYVDNIDFKIDVFKIDELVKERGKLEIFNQLPNSDNDLDYKEKVDDIIISIDKKIAELEVKEKIDKLKGATN